MTDTPAKRAPRKATSSKADPDDADEVDDAQESDAADDTADDSEPDIAAHMTPTGPVVDTGGTVPKAAKGNIYVELQRSLTGWGAIFDVIEVDGSNPDVQALIEQELALEVKRADLVPDAG